MLTDSSRRRHHELIAEHGLPVTCAYCGRRQIVYVLDELPACVCLECWRELDRADVRPIDDRFALAGRKNSQEISHVSP